MRDYLGRLIEGRLRKQMEQNELLHRRVRKAEARARSVGSGEACEWTCEENGRGWRESGLQKIIDPGSCSERLGGWIGLGGDGEGYED